MTPSHAVKNGVRYRYYISSALIQGQKDKAATLNRVPATEIETLIISALRNHLAKKLNNKGGAQGSHSLNDKDLVYAHIARVDVKPGHLAVHLSVKPDQQAGEQDQDLSRDGGPRDHSNPNTMVVPWRKTPSKRPRAIILPAGTSSRQDSRPIRAETRARLITAIAKGRRWLDELMTGTVTNVEQIASTENCTVRQVNMTISLAFLAPNLVQAAVEGRLPRGVGIANLRDAPAEWPLQYARLGLAS
jgi:hypothetical protein